MASDVRWRRATRPWYHNRGMSPLLGILALAALFASLVVVMLGREGRKEARPPVVSPDMAARASSTRKR